MTRKPRTDKGLELIRKESEKGPFIEVIEPDAPRKGRSWVGLPRPLIRIKERK